MKYLGRRDNMATEVQDFKPLPLISTMPIDNRSRAYGMRHGVMVEKGVIVTEEKMVGCKEIFKRKMEYYTAYPDMFVEEVLIPTGSGFQLLFTQRIFLRSIMRVSRIHLTASRGYSKTFLAILGFVLKAIFQPGSKLAVTAPSKKQAEQVAKDKWADLIDKFPLLEKEVTGFTTSTGNVRWNFKNGSFIEVTAPLETTRGRRFHGILFDEARDHDGDKVNTIMLPTLSDPRKILGTGLVNPNEPHQCQIYATSASSKSSYNYEKLIDLFQMAIINPKSAAAFGIDYRIPVAEGLLDLQGVQNMRFDPTFNESAFAREYLSTYTSDNEDSWFNFDRLSRHRKLKRAEWVNEKVDSNKVYYSMSVDVGRLNDQTAVTVMKNYIQEHTIKTNVVNIIILGRTPETKPFSIQARDLKEIIRAYDCRDVIIDTNGLGISLADEMIRTHIANDGTELPPLGFINDNNYKAIQPKGAPQILYSLKASQQLNSLMYSNAFSRINGGLVDFLITEQQAKNTLLGTKKGQAMSLAVRTHYLMPYEMTTKLFEEMGNLRLKAGAGGLGNIVLERINERFPKDRFSSLIMGLMRVKEQEEAIVKHTRKSRTGEPRQFTFYTPRRGNR